MQYEKTARHSLEALAKLILKRNRYLTETIDVLAIMSDTEAEIAVLKVFASMNRYLIKGLINNSLAINK